MKVYCPSCNECLEDTNIKDKDADDLIEDVPYFTQCFHPLHTYSIDYYYNGSELIISQENFHYKYRYPRLSTRLLSKDTLIFFGNRNIIRLGYASISKFKIDDFKTFKECCDKISLLA